MNIMISWFVLTLELSTRLQNTGQCIYSEWKTLENQSANLHLYVSLKEFSQSIFFFSEEGFQVWTALSLFTVNTPCQLPSHCELWHLTVPNHHTHITIEPIVRCVRNPPIKNAHIYPSFLFRRRVSSLNCSFIVYRKHSLPTPFTLWTLTSHCAQPSHTHNNWANCEVRKKPTYQKCSHISLQLCWISERALVHSFADGLHKWFRQCVGRLQCGLRLPSVQPLSDFPQTKTFNQFKKVDFYSCMFTVWSHYNKHLWKLAVLG